MGFQGHGFMKTFGDWGKKTEKLSLHCRTAFVLDSRGARGLRLAKRKFVMFAAEVVWSV